MTSDACSRIFDVVVGHEGDELDLEPEDSGNWTGGAVGAGTLRGSKYGISAASYPAVDIANLTRAGAGAIFRRDYYDPVGGDALPAPLALLVADAAYNNGLQRASRWLQAAVGVEPDGRVGPVTLAAVASHTAEHGGAALCIEFHAQRMAFMGGLPTWRTFGLGWSRRLAALPFQCVLLQQGDRL